MLSVDRRNVSFSTAVRLDALAKRLPRALRPSVSVTVPNLGTPLACRLGTSDIDVLNQIFVEKHYDSASLPETASLVLDCGANIGATTLWFANRFPTARVVAVEPDPANAWLLARNVRTVAERVSVVRGGVWSHSTRLDLRPGFDHRGWSVRVVEEQTGPICAYDIPELLAMEGRREIDVLKMDIERAEEVVLRDCRAWIGMVKVLLVEFHGDRARTWAMQSFEGILQEVEQRGEISVFARV